LLAQKYFVSPEVFAEEQAKIFSKISIAAPCQLSDPRWKRIAISDVDIDVIAVGDHLIR